MIATIFTISFIVLFIHATTWEGMINGWVSNLCDNWPEWIKKPLYDCPICMCPWWGSLILYFMGSHIGVLEWILTVFAAGGVNTVIVNLSRND